MRPEVDQILMITAGQVATELGPNLPTQYAQGMAQLAAVMDVLAAQEYDRAADIRAAENREMRALFADLAPSIADKDLMARLQKAAADTDASLRVSTLNEANYALRELLIALHEHVEAEAGKAGRAAETRIWKLLMTFAARRRLYLPQS
jgi:hypothetical protein